MNRQKDIFLNHLRPKTKIEPDSKKEQYEISWPNVLRIDHIYRTKLSLDLNKVKPLEIKIQDTLTKAELAKILEGKPDTTDISQIDLASLGLRLQDAEDHIHSRK